MSHILENKRAAAVLRKQRQRAKLAMAGRTKVEPWITAKTRELMRSFGDRVGLDLKAVVELVLESATPLYLAEISRRIDALEPIMARIREFEYWGIHPSTIPTLPIRVSGTKGGLELDPKEYRQLLETVYPLISQLERYGISRSMVSRIVPPKVRKPRHQKLT